MQTKNGFFTSPLFLFALAPALVFAFPHLFLLTGGYDRWIMPTPREIGYVENATALFFMIGGVYAVWLMGKDPDRGATLFKATLLFIAAGAVFVCLEEISYGQQFFHYGTPEWFLEHNKNLELNLHNLGQDKPAYAMRTMGYVVVSLVGVVAPLVVRAAKLRFAAGGWFYFFTPSAWLIFPSLLHLFANLPKAIVKIFPGGEAYVQSSYYFAESGEYEEYMMGVWVILFLVMTHRAALRLREQKPLND